MNVRGRDLAADLRGRADRAVPIVASAVAALSLVLAGGPLGGLIVRVLAAGMAASFVHRGWTAASGRERQVRGWILVALGVWFVAEVARFTGALTGRPMLLAELSLIGLAVAAIGKYVSAVRGRMRPADETALYLDAVSIFATTTALVVVIGGGLAVDPGGVAVLAHAAFFLAIMTATLQLDFATRVPLRFYGQWEMLAGLTVGGGSYLALLLPLGDPTARAALHAGIAGGALLVGHGGSRWSADTDTGRLYTTIVGWFRAILPLASVVITAALMLAFITTPTLVDGPLRLVVAAAPPIVVICIIARQTVLLGDRERVIGREHQLTDELTVAEAQYRSVVERVPGVVYVAEAGEHGRWHFVSSQIEDLLGYTQDEWLADPALWVSSIHPADRDRMVIAELEETGRDGNQGRWEYRLVARDGRVVWVIDDEAVIRRDDDGRPNLVQGILVDISDRKDLEEQLRHQALHDPLTGLSNRVLFIDRLGHAMARRSQSPDIAVLFVDLDDFKAINDTLGHAAGDDLLRLVADRLSGVLRAGDTASRLGGDEFAFLLEDSDPERANSIAHRILTALAQPFELADRAATLTASVGIAIPETTLDGHPTQSADDLLRDADTAMYVAKSHGAGLVTMFERGMDTPIQRRRELRAALDRALEADDQLLLEYQPIVDMSDASVLGIEALVRWNHPVLGRLMPGDFIGLAENTGLIGRLGEWVLRHACAELPDGPAVLSVNVSADQLGHGTLPGLVESVLADSGVSATRLMLELTESTMASAGAGAEAELLRIRELGVRIALDDFGAGYSSLEYLGRLPVDVLKVDRSLVEHVHTEPTRREVMRAIGHIAKRLDLETIVEGVEEEAQRRALLHLGFRHAQGFLFSRAVPMDQALDPLETRRAS